MGFKNPFAKKKAPKDAEAAGGSVEKEAPNKLSAKELRQQKRDRYYKNKAGKEHEKAPPSPIAASAPSHDASPAASPRAASPSSVEANSAASPAAAPGGPEDAASVASGRSGAPEAAGAGPTSAPAEESPAAAEEGAAAAGRNGTPALINKSGSSEVETYQPPRVEAERRKAEAAALGLAPVGEEGGGAAAAADQEDRDGPAADPTCNYCGCFN